MNKTILGFIKRSDEYKLLSEVLGRKEALKQLKIVVRANKGQLEGYDSAETGRGLKVRFGYNGKHLCLMSFVGWRRTPQGFKYWDNLNDKLVLKIKNYCPSKDYTFY